MDENGTVSRERNMSRRFRGSTIRSVKDIVPWKEATQGAETLDQPP